MFSFRKYFLSTTCKSLLSYSFKFYPLVAVVDGLGENTNTGAVVGGIAGVLGLVIIGSLVLLLLRRNNRLPGNRIRHAHSVKIYTSLINKL